MVEEDVPWDFSAELQALASDMIREADAKSDEPPLVKIAPVTKPKERARARPLAVE